MADDFVIINVGGTMFETTVNTLSRSLYFRRIFSSEWNADQGLIKIDRSAILFEHVLSFLRNPEYPYPHEHVGELDFYLINHNISSLDIQKEQQKIKDNRLDTLWNYVKNNTNICKVGECGNVPYPKFKYCFDCVKPVLVPLSQIHQMEQANVQLIYCDGKYKITTHNNDGYRYAYAYCDVKKRSQPIGMFYGAFAVTQKDGPQVAIEKKKLF